MVNAYLLAISGSVSPFKGINLMDKVKINSVEQAKVISLNCILGNLEKKFDMSYLLQTDWLKHTSNVTLLLWTLFTQDIVISKEEIEEFIKVHPDIHGHNDIKSMISIAAILHYIKT